MGQDEGREDQQDREDLFEDLDKFFEPIKDVDWPEAAAEPGAPAAPAEPASPTGPAVTEPASPTGPAVTEPAEPTETVGAPEERPAEEAAGATEALFTTSAQPPEPSWEAEPEEPEGAEEGDIEAFLFAEEGEGEEDVGEAIAAERERAPEAYVDLPGPEEPGAVAEPIEEPEPMDVAEAPSEEDLEAAAEHFAESVRQEVVLGEPEGADTEPDAGIEELLGPLEEGAEAEEEAQPEGAVRTVRVGAEALGGPSWQEPTTVEVGPEAERSGPGRNVQLAFLTGIVLAALAVGAIAIGTGPFAILAGAIVLVAQGEFYFALQKRHYQPATALGLVAGALVLGAAYYSGEAAMLSIVGLGAIASFLWYMTVPESHRRNVVSNVGLTVLGIVWMPMLAGTIFVLLPLVDGRALVLSILGLTVAYDASAFAVGYFWGSRPLAATISPKKSWEGAIGATLVVVAVAIGVVAPAVDLLDTIPRAVGLAVVVALFAPLGDLAESLVKRDLGIKDMGSILPGHGGVLDRIDAMLFVAPAALLYLRIVLS